MYWSAGRQIFIAAQFKQVESDLAGSVHTASDFFHGSSAGKPGKLSGRTFYIGNSECDFLFAAVCGIGSSGLSLSLIHI